MWKDKLIAYDGKTITYDVFGCPTDYMGSAMTWDIYGGLTSVDNGTDTITYTYMGDGQRRSKTVNGVTTTYHYNNGMLLSETTGDETLRYYYDSTGKVASLVYKKGDEEERSYFYTRNVQGDITAVYRSKDSKLMGTYEYDLWGRLISITPTDKDTDGITEKNPYRYRGYYYDNETGFYYLKARYYDPQIRRFISADSLSVLMVATIDVSSKNLFAYSENNPVTSKDSSGMFAETVFDVISLAGSIAEVCANPYDVGAWINAGAELVDVAVPFVTGVGEAVRGVRAAAKVAEAADDVGDAVKVADKASDAAKKVSKRLEYMGKTPGKNSKTGKSVIARMQDEGKIREFYGETQFLDSNNKWHPLCEADMAHKTDAVTWWNEVGRQYGPKAPEVREFMLDSDNYYLEHYSINRAAGARLGQQYLPPLQ